MQGGMKKLVNDVHASSGETLEGFALAHPSTSSIHYSPHYVTRHVPKAEGKVGLVSGGGSDTSPCTRASSVKACWMYEAARFTSPTPDLILEATKAADHGAGVLHIVKNYTAMSCTLRPPPSWPTWRTSRSLPSSSTMTWPSSDSSTRRPPRRRRDHLRREDRGRCRRARTWRRSPASRPRSTIRPAPWARALGPCTPLRRQAPSTWARGRDHSGIGIHGELRIPPRLRKAPMLIAELY